ncbi:hypothetical protein OIO90_001580 [Microbotryomycetes sp. JL221]|nr:hypothetical protein OIO90_001580 [Microbotryomycetes sp. JL221]
MSSESTAVSQFSLSHESDASTAPSSSRSSSTAQRRQQADITERTDLPRDTNYSSPSKTQQLTLCAPVKPQAPKSLFAPLRNRKKLVVPRKPMTTQQQEQHQLKIDFNRELDMNVANILRQACASGKLNPSTYRDSYLSSVRRTEHDKLTNEWKKQGILMPLSANSKVEKTRLQANSVTIQSEGKTSHKSKLNDVAQPLPSVLGRVKVDAIGKRKLKTLIKRLEAKCASNELADKR